MPVFYFFALVVLLLGLLSLRGGVRYLAYFRSELARCASPYAPFASVIAPCRGLDQGLRENLRALFEQDYPVYEIVFVSDREDDPALSVVEEVRREFAVRESPRTRISIAGPAQASGQKVHNLSAAVYETDSASEVLVFVDTDARPAREWLRSLVAPLEDEAVGAATGYRWFVPVKGGVASRVRAVWNASIASALGASRENNFCWGGSTAIRRATFERLCVLKAWAGALSDDFALTRTLQSAGLPIHFVPACLTASLEDCSFAGLLEFTTRQMKITRVYAPHLWRAILVSGFVFVPVFFGGWVLALVRAALGLSYLWPLALLIATYLLGVWKAWLRFRAVKLALPGTHRELLRRDAFAQLCLWPLATALFFYNSIAAGFSRRIKWRGITYELRSPRETLIISGQTTSGEREAHGAGQES